MATACPTTATTARPQPTPTRPTLTATVNAFTRLWLGVRPATGLAVTDDLSGPPELLQQLDQLARRLQHHLVRRQQTEMQRLDYLARRLVHPAEQLRRRRTDLQQLAQRLRNASGTRLTAEQLRLARLNQRLVTPIHVIRREQQRLDTLGMRARREVQGGFGQRQLNLDRFSSSLAHLNPEGVLARGYSIVQLENGTVVQDAAALHARERIGIRFHRGQAHATVDSTTKP